jgi:hypothetical protein
MMYINMHFLCFLLKENFYRTELVGMSKYVYLFIVPGLDPLVIGQDPDADPPIIKQK